MANDDLKIGDVKARVRATNRAQIRDLLESLTRDTGVYVEYVETERIYTDDGVVGYAVKLDVKLGR